MHLCLQRVSNCGFRCGQCQDECAGVAESRAHRVRRHAGLDRRHADNRQQPKKAEHHRVESTEADVRVPDRAAHVPSATRADYSMCLFS